MIFGQFRHKLCFFQSCCAGHTRANSDILPKLHGNLSHSDLEIRNLNDENEKSGFRQRTDPEVSRFTSVTHLDILSSIIVDHGLEDNVLYMRRNGLLRYRLHERTHPTRQSNTMSARSVRSQVTGYDLLHRQSLLDLGLGHKRRVQHRNSTREHSDVQPVLNLEFGDQLLQREISLDKEAVPDRPLGLVILGRLACQHRWKQKVTKTNNGPCSWPWRWARRSRKRARPD